MLSIRKIADKHSLSYNHWYRFLPRRLQYYIAHTGVKKRYGKLQVVAHHPDGTTEISNGYNIITDDGIIRLGDILAGVETTNTQIGYIEAGSGTTTPVVGDSALDVPLTGPGSGRRAVDTQTRSTSSPYEVVVSEFIDSNTYTRDQTINELGIFFEASDNNMFARGVLAKLELHLQQELQQRYPMVWCSGRWQ
jgi:hypothetical protein